MWTVAILIAAIFLVIHTLSFSSRYLAGSVTRLGTSVGLGIPENLRAQLAVRNASRARAVSIGAILGTAAIVAAVTTGLIAPSDDPTDPASLWLLIGGGVTGLAVGSALAALRTRPVVPEGERVARSGAVGLDDYLAPVDLAGSRIAVAIGVVVLVISHIAGLGLTVGGVVIITSVIALVMFEVLARRILERALPVGASAELAWNDALRARAMRDIASAPMCLGAWGALAVIITLATATDGLIFAATGGVLVFAATFAAAAFSIATKPQQHYLRRLWPDVAAAARATAGAR
jgi:hypothetical protein